MTEPLFEVYNKNREEVPTVEESINSEKTVDGVEPDKTIRGYQNLMDFLDSSVESELVDHPEHGEVEIETGQYRWKEVGVENAPTVEICSECGATIQTNSDERVEAKKNIHHIGTGH